ncbi:hypothetical protein [Sinisalibacter aestuarii]|uniref:Uncharacterized protein n=1 Tax=Sinisalibacter aestuarii TaxID=2949426 RepID=A0ABQ5LYT6_9RHOB|nr:hypothetical protein [Sinisalibacter aestuarii]GKY90117.1 hypothetical protein STA1M1_39860 [Sinisalibacter aestuarii]
MTLTATLNDQATTASVTVTQDEQSTAISCDAAELDRMIADLVAVRAAMQPAKQVALTAGETPVYDCDNLLWDTLPDPSRRGVVLAMYHSGLGWVTMRLSRAQIEDLITGIEFSLADLARMPGFQNQRPATADNEE